jgi:AcrR family transcriptional regulator
VTATTAGRAAQRRRTRRAIVEATISLLEKGIEPSVNEIAEAAEVSRRTVYLHFPTLDQLILDATLGMMNLDVDARLEQVGADPHARLAVLVEAMSANIEQSMPLGRRLIRLTVDSPPRPGEPRRGYRRVGWIEAAIEPVRDRLGPQRFEDLVSSLAMVVGWEAVIVLSDVRGLAPDAARAVSLRAAHTLLDAALAEARAATRSRPAPRPRRST